MIALKNLVKHDLPFANELGLRPLAVAAADGGSLCVGRQEVSDTETIRRKDLCSAFRELRHGQDLQSALRKIL
jgi:hypothetical protein